jgi:hypothetical protein
MSTTGRAPAINEDKMNAFLGKVVGDFGASLSSAFRESSGRETMACRPRPEWDADSVKSSYPGLQFRLQTG